MFALGTSIWVPSLRKKCMAFGMDWVARKRINRNIDPGNLNIELRGMNSAKEDR